VLFRDGLQQIIDDARDLRVVAVANTSQELEGIVSLADPDVVVYHTVARNNSECDAVRAVLARNPCIGVVLLITTRSPTASSLWPAAQFSTSALRLTTAASSAQFLAAVRMAWLRSGGGSRAVEPTADALSPRETEVIKLVALAYTNGQIARQLQISENTVKRHLRSIFRKLNAVSRIDAVNRLAR